MLIKFEKKKTILHIFNSKFYLDKKKLKIYQLDYLEIFILMNYLFHLINKNDYKNLKNIFDKCNLKIKKFFKKKFC